MDIEKELRRLSDPAYADFQSRLTPDIGREKFLGVRVPQVRMLAKQLVKEGKAETFLSSLPHTYYDENMLHGLILSEWKDYGDCMERLEAFLPFVDNWAVCDIMSPKCFRKNREALLPKLREWMASEHTYTCRFAIEELMSLYLDEYFREEYLSWVSSVRGEDYYRKMMVAWFFATALAKQWESTVPYLTGHKLSPWVHQKTIQKAVESYRIPADRKEYLKSLRISREERSSSGEPDLAIQKESKGELS